MTQNNKRSRILPWDTSQSDGGYNADNGPIAFSDPLEALEKRANHLRSQRYYRDLGPKKKKEPKDRKNTFYVKTKDYVNR